MPKGMGQEKSGVRDRMVPDARLPLPARAGLALTPAGRHFRIQASTSWSKFGQFFSTSRMTIFST